MTKKLVYKINYRNVKIGGAEAQVAEDSYYINGPVAIEYMELNNGKKILFLSDYHTMHKSACSNLPDKSHLNINNSIDLNKLLELIINSLEIDGNCVDFFLEANHTFDKTGGAHLQINKIENNQKLINNLRKNFHSNNDYLRVHNFDVSMFRSNDGLFSIFMTILLDIADKIVLPTSDNLIDYFTKLFHELITVQDEYSMINELILHNEKHFEQLNQNIEELNQKKVIYKAKFENEEYDEETYNLISEGLEEMIEKNEKQIINPFGIKTKLINILNTDDSLSNQDFLKKYSKYLNFIATKINKQLDISGMKKKIIEFYTDKLIKINSKIDSSITNPKEYLSNLRVVIIDLYTTARLFRKFDESKKRTLCTDENSMNNIIMFGGKSHIDNYIEFTKQMATEGLLQINFSYKTQFIEKPELEEDDNPEEYSHFVGEKYVIINQCQKVNNTIFKPFGINVKSLIRTINSI